MHPAARNLPPYAAASLAAFVLLAVPPALVACVAGAVSLVLAVLVAIGALFNGETGLSLMASFGFAVAGIGGTLVALLAIGTLALLASTVVLPALAFAIRLVLRALGVRSRLAGVAVFLVAGQLLGLAAAAGIHALGAALGWRVDPAPVVLLYVSAPFLSAVVVTLYGAVLLATDAAGAAASRAASAVREATARPLP